MGKIRLEVQSLQRALDIMEVVGGSGRPVPLKAIVAATGLPKSTVYRLLCNLEARGFVDCDAGCAYRLGLRFLTLGSRSDGVFGELGYLGLSRPLYENAAAKSV